MLSRVAPDEISLDEADHGGLFCSAAAYRDDLQVGIVQVPNVPVAKGHCTGMSTATAAERGLIELAKTRLESSGRFSDVDNTPRRRDRRLRLSPRDSNEVNAHVGELIFKAFAMRKANPRRHFVDETGFDAVKRRSNGRIFEWNYAHCKTELFKDSLDCGLSPAKVTRCRSRAGSVFVGRTHDGFRRIQSPPMEQ